MSITVREYLDKSPNDINCIYLNNCNLTELPDLSRFTNLKRLECINNKLTQLSNLPDTIEELLCYQNELVTIDKLPNKLKYLYCYTNKLTSLPKLPDCLLNIDCFYNELIQLPILPNNLIRLDCNNNKLESLPILPKSLLRLYYYSNPICNIIPDEHSYRYYRISNYEVSLALIIERVKILNSFRYLYYSLKYKKQLRDLLYQKIRKPKIEMYYCPENLIHILDNINNKNSMNEFVNLLNNW